MFKRPSVLLGIIVLMILSGCGGGGNPSKTIQLTEASNNLSRVSWNDFISITQEVIKDNPGISDEKLSQLIQKKLATSATGRKIYIPLLDEANRPTAQEFILAVNNPRKAILTLLATQIARTESRSLFPQDDVRGSPGWRTKEDAFRHSFWNALICSYVSESWAEKWTNAHESEEDPNNRDTIMDLHNNAVGRYVYHQNRWSAIIAKNCEAALFGYQYTKMPLSTELGACYDLSILIYIRNNDEAKEGVPCDQDPGDCDNLPIDDWPNINVNVTLADILQNDFDIDQYILEWSGGSSEDTSTPDPTDTTPPTVSWARINVLGSGRFDLVTEFADSSSGVDKNRFWLQDPSYQWHQIGNWNFDNPSTLPVDMNGQTLVGNWKFFVEAFDKSGNHLDRTDTGQSIGWGAPWIEDQSMEGPSSTGQSVYRAKFDSFGGHADIDWSYLFYWIGSRYYQIGGRVSGYQAQWNINPLDYSNMEKGKAYALTLIIQSKNGLKADQIPAGYYLTVPDVLVPLERGKESLVKYEPSGVGDHVYDTYFDITGWQGPFGPNKPNVDLAIRVIGTEHHSSTEHCPVVYGKGGNGASYQVMGTWGYGYWMHLYGNINSFPTGLFALGGEMKWDGRITGPMRAQDAWIWVDNDHPLFDKIIEGPTSGSVIRKSQNTELCIRTTMQDPGGSGTAEYWLALVGQGQERGFKERIYGYTGINHCTLDGLPNGQYRLYVTYSQDQIGNIQTRSIATDVTYEIVD